MTTSHSTVVRYSTPFIIIFFLLESKNKKIGMMSRIYKNCFQAGKRRTLANNVQAITSLVSSINMKKSLQGREREKKRQEKIDNHVGNQIVDISVFALKY